MTRTIIGSMAPPPDSLLTLNTAALIGVVIALLVAMALVYTCGLLTGLLVRRRRGRSKSYTPSSPGDQSAPMYEQVALPPTQTTIPLEENVAYGHLK